MDSNSLLRLPACTKWIQVEEIPSRIAHAIRPTRPRAEDDPEWEHDASEDVTVRKLIINQHTAYLHHAIRNGKLVARNPFTRLPDACAEGDRLNQALVDVTDLTSYVNQFDVAVIIEAETSATNIAESVNRESSEHNSNETPLPGMGWALKKPERYQGYRKPLYDFLKSVHAAGLPCPTAHDVLDEFRKKSNSDVIEVMSDGLKYASRRGTREADLNAIQRAIGRLVIRPPSNQAD
jgi:hypothetical protein